MLARLLVFLLCLGGGAAMGYAAAGDRGGELGLIAGAIAWFTLETARAARALRWLRNPDLQRAHGPQGLQGEPGDGTRQQSQLAAALARGGIAQRGAPSEAQQEHQQACEHQVLRRLPASR